MGQLKIDSNDYAEKTLAASQIPETGVVGVYGGIDEYETKYGPGKNCFVIAMTFEGKTESEGLIFSSKRLATALRANQEKLLNQKVKLCGFGSGKERHYTVELL